MTAPTSHRTSRNQTLEALRVVAAFAIVWYHSKAVGGEVAYSGLSFFILLTVSFAVRNGSAPQSRMARTLLVPWAAWFIVYGLVNLVVGRPFFPYGDGFVANVLAAPSIHLWYLPWIWVVIGIVGWIATRVPSHLIFAFASAGTVLVTLSAPFWQPSTLATGYPWAQYAQAITPVLLGMAFGSSRSKRLDQGVILGLIALLFLATGAGYAPPGSALPHAIAATLLFISSHRPIHWLQHRNVERLSSGMLGVYLVHPLFIAGLNRASELPLPVVACLAFALSTVAVLAWRGTVAQLNKIIFKAKDFGKASDTSVSGRES